MTHDPLEGFPSPSYPLGADPSFFDLVRATQDPAAQAGIAPSAGVQVPHGTTVLALKFSDGVVMAGDRRAVEGFNIADERIEKVFPADESSAIAIAGAAGQATEIVRLFQTELEHYEKVEGDRLSLEGKANRLAQMIRGGRWEEADYHSTGSGGTHARSTLKKRWRHDLSPEEAVRIAVEALYDASQEDVATGGPNPARNIYPSVKTITAEGVVPVPEERVRQAFEAIVGSTQESGTQVGGSSARETENHDRPESGS